VRRSVGVPVTTSTQAFFTGLWNNYVEIAPQAARIHQLFTARGERIVNDHVAFRTYGRDPLNMDTLEPLILALGYRPHEPYAFPDKGLVARSYLPADPDDPRIFLSELRLDTLAPQARRIVCDLVAQVDTAALKTPEVFRAGRLWKTPSWDAYQTLIADNEYAAWVSVMGLRPNHFTISVNALRHTPDLNGVVRLLKQHGFPVNAVGGEIKGSAQVLLEQAATLADRVTMEFADGDCHEVPTCYYEFARRYRDATGHLYQGFVAASADRLFESTRA